ncbi:Ligatin [Termitomyces sp. J132]|nr:Ligatin [Termitomyces sp. J132]
MFKKPLGGLKTSAPLRGSERRKLKQRVVSAFEISSEDGDLLVPDGIQSVKFTTHLEEPGVAYLAPDGNPLWFTLGKGSEDLIPTVYSLWKRRDLLPVISTPAAVIPILVGGADLMIPGVVHHTPGVKQDQLVSILQVNKSNEVPTLAAPFAVGRMALPGDQLGQGTQGKGKAVFVLHTWKDHLWDLGSKGDVPQPIPLNPAPEKVPAHKISSLLHTSLLQVISSTIPSSAFPIPATLFYTNYILPSRPAFPALVVPHSGRTPPDASPCPSASEITIKSSTHKSLTAFLKNEEKAGLITIKVQKHSNQTDLVITSVNAKHPSVDGHRLYATLKDIEITAAKKAKREEKAREEVGGSGEVLVMELWKPHQATVALFERMGGDISKQYTMAELKATVNSYIAANSLVNLREQAYINLDEPLIDCISSKVKRKTKDDGGAQAPLEFMRRDELMKQIADRMQNWYEISDGKEVVRRKGELKPIQVVMKVRQGRKVSTLISGFEPFLVLNAEDMAEDLRKACAGATSISPIHGKPAGAGMEVMVQGKQSQAVMEYLTGKGIPKKWIETHDLSGKK